MPKIYVLGKSKYEKLCRCESLYCLERGTNRGGSQECTHIISHAGLPIQESRCAMTSVPGWSLLRS